MWQAHPWALVSGLAALAALAVRRWSRVRQGDRASTEAFGWVAAGLAVGCAGQTLDLSSREPTIKQLGLYIQLIGLVPLPATSLRFALTITGRGALLTRRRWVLLLLPALVALALMLTNRLHQWMATSEWVVVDGFFLRHTMPRPAIYGYVLYSYVCGLVTAFLFGAQLWSGSWLSRRQATLLLASWAFPTVTNVLFFTGVLPWAHVDGSVAAFGVTLACWALAMRRGRMLELLPVARSTVFETLHDAVAVVDAQRRVLDANPAFLGLVGRPHEKVIGVDLASLEVSDAPSLSKAGRQLEVSSRPAGEARVLVFRDVTVESAAAEGLRSAAAMAQSLTAEREAMLARISHELRNPIQALVGAARLALPEATDPTARRTLETIERSGVELSSLADQLLAYGRLQASAVTAERAPFDVHQLLGDAQLLARSAVGERPIVVSLHISAAVPQRVSGDGLRLRQVVSNLWSNAVKFTERGEVRIEANLVAGQLRVRVVDTGPGIPADARERIFEPFIQGHAQVAATHGGAGLGLAICRELAHLMGGDLELVPAERGAAFELRVPVQSLPESTDAADWPVSILLVDDHELSRTLSAQLLQKEGCSVTEVGSAAECLQAVGRASFDAVLLDRHLPDSSGESLAMQLAGRGPRLFFLSADARLTGTLPAGVEAVLSKPLDVGALRRLMARPVVQQTARQQLLAAFAATSARELSQLTATDPAVAARAMHDLLGSAKVVGAATLVRLCTSLTESSARPLAPEHVRQLEAARAEDLRQLGGRP